MSHRYFGQFLLERGLIEPAALLQAVETQGRINQPLGVLAVHYGRLTMAQMRALRREQLKSGAPLGVLAVRAGLLRELTGANPVGILTSLDSATARGAPKHSGLREDPPHLTLVMQA